MRLFWCALSVCLLAPSALLGGCDEGATSEGAASGAVTAGVVPCAPLEPLVAPATVGATLAIGRDAGGALYVIEAHDRFFVSIATGLQRRDVLGSGQSNEEGASLTIVSALEPDGRILSVEAVTTGGLTRMGITREPLAGKTFVIGEIGEELQVLDASAIVGVRATETIVPRLEHVAELDDGRLVVIVGRQGSSVKYEDFRLFFGVPAELVERRVTSYGRTKGSPGSDMFAFSVGAASGTGILGNGASAEGAGTLTLEGREHVAVALPGLPAGAGFVCEAR